MRTRLRSRALKAAWRGRKPIGGSGAAGRFRSAERLLMERDELYAALESVHGEADGRPLAEPDARVCA